MCISCFIDIVIQGPVSSLGEYPDGLSFSHQNWRWRLGGGDRRGAAGRMSAAQEWRAQGLNHSCRPGLSRVITPILASLGVFLVRKAHSRIVRSGGGARLASRARVFRGRAGSWLGT